VFYLELSRRADGPFLVPEWGFIYLFPGLYFKLHGTHRPNSMKKTVIKRRKRVPAAGVSPGRMSDQAAAEALVAVGRIGGHGSGGGGDDESDGEVAEQPRKKRARKSGVGKNDKDKGGRGGRRRGGDDDDGDDGEGGIDEDGEPRRKKSRDGSGWADVTGPSSSSSPRLDPRSQAQNQDPYAHLQRGQFLGSPHHHGGFDLPPLNAAIGGDRDRNAYSPYNPAMAGHYPGAPSSYIRSGSNAPSRTHSPLGPAGLGGGPGQGYALPPPHQLMHAHGGGGGYYPVMGHSPGSHEPPASVMAGLMGMGMTMGVPTSSSPSAIPTVGELERHYYQLSEQRKGMAEMLERTDRMMISVKKGLDEMKAGQQGEEGNGGGVDVGGGGGAAVPLNRPSSDGKDRRDIWPTDPSPRD
jgi:GATA-binding protein, other eukaryote